MDGGDEGAGNVVTHCLPLNSLPTPVDARQPAQRACRYKQLTLQRGVRGTARMLHALTHSSFISRQVREQM